MTLPTGIESTKIQGPTTGDIYLITKSDSGKFLVDVRGVDKCGVIGRFNSMTVVERVIKSRESMLMEVAL